VLLNLNAAPIVKISSEDGIHLTRESQKDFAEAVARKVEEMKL